MSDDPLSDATTRAAQAYDLLNHDLLKEAFETLRDDYMNLWRHTKSDQVDAREKIFIAWHVVGKVQEHLQRQIENGKLAQKELDELIAADERRKLFGFR